GSALEIVDNQGNIFTPFERLRDNCTQAIFGPFDMTNDSNWTSSDPNIVSTNQTGWLNCLAPGECGISAQWETTVAFGQDCTEIRSTVGSGGPIEVKEAKVTKTDIKTDQIEVVLSPSTEPQHQLTVILVGSSGNVTLFSGLKAGGTHSFSFNRENLPQGQYTSVRAQWQVSSTQTATGEKQSKFKVLGTYRHSQYNTPQESACTGSLAQAFITQASCSSQETQLKSDFISQAWLNGSGKTINFSFVQNEAFCTLPPGGEDKTFRQVSQITPACGQGFALNNNTVAGNPNHQDLVCGDEVLILSSSPAIKTVTDRCPACSLTQLDNYTTQAACAPGSIPDLGNFKTIRVNR
ncbi:MAG: hypothetical protein ACRD47_12315, partial [Nitrososphaeraceae archaeon]